MTVAAPVSVWPIMRGAFAAAPATVRTQVKWVAGLWVGMFALQVWDSWDGRVLWAMVIGAVGALQAWDSGVFGAGRAVQALTAIAAPVCGLLVTRQYGLQAASVFVMAVLLTWARVIAPISLNGLHIALVPASLLVFVFFRRQADTVTVGGHGAPAALAGNGVKK